MPISSRWTLPIPNISLPSFLFTSSTHPLPLKPAFLDASRPDTHQLSLNTFRLWSQRFASGLKNAGLQPGDRVLLFSGNNVFFPVVFIGVLMAGGIFTGANPGYVTRELAYQLKDSGARFLICADGSLEMGLEAAESIGMGRDRIFSFDDDDGVVIDGHRQGQRNGKRKRSARLGVRHWSDLIAGEEEGKAFVWEEPRDARESVCCLNYSSGTTGVPKGVMISHFAYVANAMQYNHMPSLHPDYEERTKKAYVSHVSSPELLSSLMD